MTSPFDRPNFEGKALDACSSVLPMKLEELLRSVSKELERAYELGLATGCAAEMVTEPASTIIVSCDLPSGGGNE